MLTREKAVDIIASVRFPYVIDEFPSYLEVPEINKENRIVYRELLHGLADRAPIRFTDNKEMVKWFEEELRERLVPGAAKMN